MENYKRNKHISELARIFGILRRTIGSSIKKFEEFGLTEDQRGKGKILFTDRQLYRMAKLNRRRSLEDITRIINEGRNLISVKKQNIQRKLADLEYKRIAAKQQVVVTEVNKKKRVAWARTIKNWIFEAEWKCWAFSDECQIVTGKKKRTYIWKDSEVNSSHLFCRAPSGRIS